MPRGECGHASDVVRVLVRDENRSERGGGEPQSCEARHAVANAETAIDQDSGAGRLDDEAVALAATAERCEAHARELERSRRTRRYFN